MIIRDLINNCGVDRFVKMTEDCRGAHGMSKHSFGSLFSSSPNVLIR